MSPQSGSVAGWQPGETGSSASTVRSVERYLTLAWLSLAAIAIGLATLYAIVLVAARTPQVARLLPQGDLFHTALVLHVDLAAVIWFFAMAGALWNLAAPARLIRLRWCAFGLNAGGMAALALSPLLGSGPPMANNYVPVLDGTLFLSGLVWFFLGTTLASLLALLPGGGGRAGIATIGLRLAALVTLAASAALVASAIALPADLERGLYFELLSWGSGHIAQFAFTLLMLVAWVLLAPAAGLSTPSRTLLVAIFSLAALPVLPALLLQGLYAPDAVTYRKGFTALMAYAAWPAPLLLGAWLAAALLRSRGAADPVGARSVLRFSMLLFAAGCLLGAFIRTDSTLVPAHYHGTVGGVTMSLMGLLLYFGHRLRDSPAPALVRRLPLIYGSGLLLMVAGLAWLAAEGAPRKMPHTELSDSLGHLAASSLTGLGGLLAIVGGLIFLYLAAHVLWQGQPCAVEPSTLLRIDPVDGAGALPRARRDARPRALLLTATGVLTLGLALAYLPRTGSLRDGVAHALAGFAPVDKPSHVAQKRREETDLRFAQGVVMLHAKQYEHAVTAFHRVIEIAPDMPEAHVNMGYALIGLRRFEAARDFFDGALALRRDQLNAYYGLAEALEGLNDLPGAVGAMRTYVHLASPDDPFRRKAEAALWQWQERLAQERAQGRPVAPAVAPGRAAAR